MRVLHLVSSLDPRAGGPPKALVGFASALVKLQLHVTVLSTTRPDDRADYADDLKAGGVDVTLIGPMRTPLRIHPDLKKAVKEGVQCADVVHIHGIWDPLQHLGAALARRSDVPYIFRPCGMLDPWSLRQSRWKKRLYLAILLRRDLNAAAAIHYTTATERDLAAPFRLRPQAIVEPNGIDLTEFEHLPPAGTFRDKYPQIGDRPIVLFLGRLHPKKGPDILIEAFARAALPDAVLVLAGPGDENYVADLRMLVAKHRLEDRVIFTGMLLGRDRIAVYADADLFCLPSHQENFGIAVVEALAAGTPVLVSDQVNIFREVEDAGVATVVALRTDALVEKLARVNNPVASLERCTAFARENYNWSKIAASWIEHYKNLSGHHS